LPFLLFDLPGWFSRATLDIFQTQLATYSNFRLLNYCLLLAVFFITEVAQIVGYSYVLKVNVQQYFWQTLLSWATVGQLFRQRLWSPCTYLPFQN
jgi:hypothetical protein